MSTTPDDVERVHKNASTDQVQVLRNGPCFASKATFMELILRYRPVSAGGTCSFNCCFFIFLENCLPYFGTFSVGTFCMVWGAFILKRPV